MREGLQVDLVECRLLVGGSSLLVSCGVGLEKFMWNVVFVCIVEVRPSPMQFLDRCPIEKLKANNIAKAKHLGMPPMNKLCLGEGERKRERERESQH